MAKRWKKWAKAASGPVRLLSGQYRAAVADFLSLGLLRTTDALVLLFLIPIIIARVGIDNFGIIAFVQVFLNYGKTMVSYGFNISGVQEVVLHAGDKKALSRLFSNILATRAVIALLSGLGLAFLVGAIPYLRVYSLVFFWGYALVLGQVVFTDWLFIGLQKASYLTAANLFSKLLFALLAILFIRQPPDYVYVTGLQGAAALISGLSVIGILKYRYGLCVMMPEAGAVRRYLHTDFKLLATNLSIEINASYSLLVVNILTTNTLTGYFSVMQKLIQPLRFLLTIFSQALFPMACERVKGGWEELIRLLRHALLLFFTLPLGATAVMFLFAGPLLAYFAGPANAMLVSGFRLYLLAPLAVLANIPAYQILLAYGRKEDYSKVHILGMAGNLISSVLLARLFGLYGLITALLLTELFITFGLYFMVWKNRREMKEKISNL